MIHTYGGRHAGRPAPGLPVRETAPHPASPGTAGRWTDRSAPEKGNQVQPAGPTDGDDRTGEEGDEEDTRTCTSFCSASCTLSRVMAGPTPGAEVREGGGAGADKGQSNAVPPPYSGRRRVPLSGGSRSEGATLGTEDPPDGRVEKDGPTRSAGEPSYVLPAGSPISRRGLDGVDGVGRWGEGWTGIRASSACPTFSDVCSASTTDFRTGFGISAAPMPERWTINRGKRSRDHNSGNVIRLVKRTL